jgi:histidinol-phosphate aminotransferase
MTSGGRENSADNAGSSNQSVDAAASAGSQYEYDRADAPADALRLHLNEHTGGCSPAVTEAIARVSRETIAKYPDYTAVTAAVADHLAVPVSRVLLTNGLDEGIFAVAIAQLRQTPDSNVVGARPSGGLADAVILEPAFGMYADAVEAVGGRVVRVMPGPGLALDRDAIAAAVTPQTGALFVASPGNPSGISLSRDEIMWLSSLLPAGALLLLDEAYVEFGGTSFIAQLDACPNVVVGRTFAKAYGLAGMRVGAVVAREDVIIRLRRVLPPYSLNVFVVAALQAALADRLYMDDYRTQVAESKRRLYEACERWGLRYVKSDANFVLVHAGEKRRALLDGLEARNIYIRDRDRQPGCQGCVRVTTGLIAHTTACIDAIEEILCARA